MVEREMILMKLLFFSFMALLSANTFADQSDFLSLCKTHFNEDSAKLQTCEKVNGTLFQGLSAKDASIITTPKKIDAVAMNIDKKILFLALNDPNYLPALVYCYSVFHHWINPNKISPDALGSLSSGVSILNERLPAYQKWLSTSSEGKSCKALVEKESLLPVTNLQDSLKGYTAMIVLNPYAAILNSGNHYDSIMDDLRLTLNHERIHAYHVLCPEFEKSEREKWIKLSEAEKNKFIEKYPNYNWKDLQTAGREYSAFSLEKAPDTIGNLVKSCKIN